MTDRITINGVTISGVSGKNITIQNNKVIVDGKDITPDTKEIHIEVHGNIDRLEVDACQKVSVTGNVGNVETLSGDVEVNGEIQGSVQTMSGSVDCAGAIKGSVSTMSGNIKHRT